MIKILLAFIVFVAIASFNTTNSDDYNKMKMEERISILEKRVDSLISVLQTVKYNPQKTPITKKKKGKNNIPVVQNYSVPISEPVPPQQEPIQISKQTVSEQTSSSSQCAATTKKGARCKRSVRSGSYCWQHGG